MKYRKFKDEKISAIGMGLMRLPVIDGDSSKIDYDEAYKMMKYAYDNGVNYYDTAYVYHDGKSEAFAGDFINKYGIRKDIYLADKLPIYKVKSYEDNFKFLDEQLDRCKTDYFDFYIVHTLDVENWSTVKNCDTLKFLDEVRGSDKVKYVGFSFHDKYELFEEIIDSYDWDFCQIQLNILDENWQAGLKGLEYAREKGIPVIIMEPLKGGRIMQIKDKKVDELKREYGLEDISVAEIAMRYIFDKEGIFTVLSGVSTPGHVKENIKTASTMSQGEFTEKEKRFVKAFKEYADSLIKVDCTACKYCEEICPEDVKIADLFDYYNQLYIYKNPKKVKSKYAGIKDRLNCIQCGVCEPMCPQKIEIPKIIEEAKETIENL